MATEAWNSDVTPWARPQEGRVLFSEGLALSRDDVEPNIRKIRNS